jgi:hypothetical protein
MDDASNCHLFRTEEYVSLTTRPTLTLVVHRDSILFRYEKIDVHRQVSVEPAEYLCIVINMLIVRHVNDFNQSKRQHDRQYE